jgi:hypothetical protein
MRRMLALFTLLVAIASPAVLHAAEDSPSIKDGFDEVGRAIKNDTKAGWEATKDVSKKGWDKTKQGVGTGLEKTGEGVDKAATGMKDAGDKVKDDE